MNNEDKEDKEDGYKNLDRVNFWINNCDTKASFVLAFLGIFISVLFSSELISNIFQEYKNILDLSKLNSLKSSLKYLSAIAFLPFIWYMAKSTYLILSVLKPRIDPNIYREIGLETDSNIFYMTIAKKSFQEFSTKTNNTTFNELKKDIDSQIFINSKIAQKKFENFKVAISSIKWMIFFFLIFICLNGIIIGLK